MVAKIVRTAPTVWIVMPVLVATPVFLAVNVRGARIVTNVNIVGIVTRAIIARIALIVKALITYSFITTLNKKRRKKVER